jgi:transcriptional regulator with XRE-family HTH domain
MSKTFTPVMCRAGRALLGWSQPQLSHASGLGLSTVVDFERERRQVSSDAIAAIRSALETAGVILLAEGETTTGGAGVRLRPA